MRQTINLDEQILIMLNNLSNELKITKDEIIKKAIVLFSKKTKKQNKLSKFAGILDENSSNEILENIKIKKNKNVEINL